MEDYRAPWWLPGGHAQTILAKWLDRKIQITYARERWDTPDGDFIHVDWAGAENAARLLVLFHGLEGSSESHYAREVALHGMAGGWRCAVAHFRSCSGELNDKARAYHAGDSEEIAWILERFAARHPEVYAAGVSLGGNALLKWLAERGEAAAGVVRRAAAVSAPIDLAAMGARLSSGVNRYYGNWFLERGLRDKALAKIAKFPQEHATAGVSTERVRATQTLPEFDDALTAPLHGFAGKDDYYTRSSTVNLLTGIRVPTLVLNARNDPLLPEEVLPQEGRPTPWLETAFPAQGGHAGFPGRRQWLARRVLEFFSGGPP